jgi:hypothetical protein
MFQIAINYTKALQNIPKFGILVWKYDIWRPWQEAQRVLGILVINIKLVWSPCLTRMLGSSLSKYLTANVDQDEGIVRRSVRMHEIRYPM